MKVVLQTASLEGVTLQETGETLDFVLKNLFKTYESKSATSIHIGVAGVGSRFTGILC
jgi:hypothetical protein